MHRGLQVPQGFRTVQGLNSSQRARVAAMEWWVWLIIVVVIVIVLVGGFIAIQAKRRSGGVIISDRKRGRRT